MTALVELYEGSIVRLTVNRQVSETDYLGIIVASDEYSLRLGWHAPVRDSVADALSGVADRIVSGGSVDLPGMSRPFGRWAVGSIVPVYDISQVCFLRCQARKPGIPDVVLQLTGRSAEIQVPPSITDRVYRWSAYHDGERLWDAAGALGERLLSEKSRPLTLMYVESLDK